MLHLLAPIRNVVSEIKFRFKEIVKFVWGSIKSCFGLSTSATKHVSSSLHVVDKPFASVQSR